MEPVIRDEMAFEQFVREWWVELLLGIAAIVAGVIVLAQPGISLVTLAWVGGIFLLVDGVFEVIAALSRRAEGRGMLALFGVLIIIVGLMLVRHPIGGVVAIAMLLGIWFVAFGTIRFVDALDRPELRLWNLFLAVVEVIVGVIIVSSPDIGVGTLALIAGIGFVLRGIGMVTLAWMMRSASRA